MMKKVSPAILFIIALFICEKNFVRAQSTVIVLAAPSVNSSYYASVFDSIIAYDINFINTVAPKEPVIILADDATLPYMQGQIPDTCWLSSNNADIWIRDFGPVMTNSLVKFDYKPDYLSSFESNYIDNHFVSWFQSAGLHYDYDSPLILDGGNFVFNGVDKAVITTRVYDDNAGYSTDEIDSIIKAITGVNEICYLPQEAGDISGHADGMVLFPSPDTVLVNLYTEPFRTEVLTDLQTQLSGITIIEVPYPYDSTLWQGWPSACGVYNNCLVTNNYIYMANYGKPEDLTFKNILQNATSKEVVPVNASNVCFMGGSVRCLTMYLKGSNADTLINLAHENLATTVSQPSSLRHPMMIFPNPMNEVTTISFHRQTEELLELTVVNPEGKIVERIENISSNSIIVHRENLIEGIYFVQLRSNHAVIAGGKLIVH